MFTSSWRTVDYDMTLADGIDEITALNPDVIGVFHSRLDETTAALQVVLDRWSGPIVIYPDAGREDYLEVWQDSLVDNEDSTAGLTQEADIWVEMGAQVIGTCCGFGVDYIKALSGALPERISSPAKSCVSCTSHSSACDIRHPPA